ncbi:MAG: ring-cleaving dioxygenase [Mucilaginibacter sp.]
MERILGLHHITAIASDAKRNHQFYTCVLGIRLVKKTVNFDDPKTYHFYYGDVVGHAGTILTFFPWEGIGKGYNGTGMATNIGYAVPKDSFSFWEERFNRFKVKQGNITEIFGEECLSFQDPDGLNIALIAAKNIDERKPWQTPEINEAVAVKGFHSVTLTLKNSKATVGVLTDILGYKLQAQDGNRYRFSTDAVATANIIDIIESPDEAGGYNAAGTNHHVAFRVKDEKVLMDYREKVLSKGLNITPKIDRDYFFSLYFREPGGVLFELATENPGFTVDEPEDQLGTHLKLPQRYESSRTKIEGALPVL